MGRCSATTASRKGNRMGRLKNYEERIADYLAEHLMEFRRPTPEEINRSKRQFEHEDRPNLWVNPLVGVVNWDPFNNIFQSGAILRELGAKGFGWSVTSVEIFEEHCVEVKVYLGDMFSMAVYTASEWAIVLAAYDAVIQSEAKERHVSS
jgi:hypothetical protein